MFEKNINYKVVIMGASIQGSSGVNNKIFFFKFYKFMGVGILYEIRNPKSLSLSNYLLDFRSSHTNIERNFSFKKIHNDRQKFKIGFSTHIFSINLEQWILPYTFTFLTLKNSI